jgi:hypothetical protein
MRAEGRRERRSSGRTDRIGSLGSRVGVDMVSVSFAFGCCGLLDP